MEDQHYNGDVWNKEAFATLSLFGWSRIGDYDMDVTGVDSKKMGLDTIVSFSTPLKTRPQLAILEAKRYLTTSFNKSLLQDWIDRLDQKLLKLRNSEKFQQQFPLITECTTADVGIIVILFSDTDNYKSFQCKFVESLLQISLSSRRRKAGVNKIYVLDNTLFMKLFSMQEAINEIKSNCKSFFFLYPSRFIDGQPICRNNTLSIEYIYSDIIFAERYKDNELQSIIFYFGLLDFYSFETLFEAYAQTSLYDKKIPIYLYVYNPDSEFRKIEPDIKERIFKDFKIEILCMASSNNIPSYIQNAIK